MTSKETKFINGCAAFCTVIGIISFGFMLGAMTMGGILMGFSTETPTSANIVFSVSGGLTMLSLMLAAVFAVNAGD